MLHCQMATGSPSDVWQVISHESVIGCTRRAYCLTLLFNIQGNPADIFDPTNQTGGGYAAGQILWCASFVHHTPLTSDLELFNLWLHGRRKVYKCAGIVTPQHFSLYALSAMMCDQVEFCRAASVRCSLSMVHGRHDVAGRPLPDQTSSRVCLPASL